MGWIPWSSGSNKDAASDGGRIAPDRTSRARCWEGRDLFFACLDKNDILDGIKEDGKARQKCAKEVAEFEEACSKSWVRTRTWSLWSAHHVVPLRSMSFFLWSFSNTNLDFTQVKYFKEKRVMEYNRDKTIERIQNEDAATVKDLKSKGWNSK
jgi:cytochrome c oxidase assembly factor 6